MRIVVFSDSHGNYKTLSLIMSQIDPPNVVIHLGDGEREMQELREFYPDIIFYQVRGNNDYNSKSPLYDCIEVGQFIISFTHGHEFGVKYSLESLEQIAQLKKVNLVLYGHTHISKIEFKEGVYYMNPGSITTRPHGTPSYGVIDITPAGLVPHIVMLHEVKFYEK